MAYFLVHRFTVKGELFPDPGDGETWNNVPLFPANDPSQNISYQQQYQNIKALLDKLGINIQKATHAFRVAGAQRLDELGIDDDVIARFGKWIRTAMLKSYLLVFKPCGLLALGGWPHARDR